MISNVTGGVITGHHVAHNHVIGSLNVCTSHEESPEFLRGKQRAKMEAVIYDGNPTIADLEIIDPYLASRVPYLKDSYLDVKARLAGGATVIIEMQVLNVAFFARRVVYNAAKTYSPQLICGQGYFKLKPVIVLTITDFEMFDNDQKVISHFVFKEKNRLFDYVDPEIELIFIELPKFNKQLDALETLTDKWIFL